MSNIFLPYLHVLVAASISQLLIYACLQRQPKTPKPPCSPSKSPGRSPKDKVVLTPSVLEFPFCPPSHDEPISMPARHKSRAGFRAGLRPNRPPEDNNQHVRPRTARPVTANVEALLAPTRPILQCDTSRPHRTNRSETPQCFEPLWQQEHLHGSIDLQAAWKGRQHVARLRRHIGFG